MPHSDSIYVLINKQAGTAMDLSFDNLTTVAGYPRNGQDNQRWRFIKHTDDTWFIQNVLTEKYLAFEKAPPGDDRVIAVKTDNPVKWSVNPDGTGDGWHIVYKGTTKNVDLFAGEATPGTAVILHDGWNGPNQIWRFEEVA